MNAAELIKNESLRMGFDLAGITNAQTPRRGAAYRSWIEAGYQGEMGWLAREPERRTDPSRVLPEARSILVVGLSYYMEEPPPDLWDDPMRGRIARYAWGRDYHDVMKPMLDELASFIARDVGRPIGMRTYVDTGPLLERELAERAGLGFVGKNTLLINSRFGSYFFLGEILLGLEVETDAPAASAAGTCGNCRRCQDVCPTHAFPAPYILDSRRCISYLTIELKSSMPEDMRPLVRNWIYGCDECQSICPWVRQYARSGKQRFLKLDPDRSIPRLADILALDEAGFRDRFAGTPMLRTKRRGLLRNAAVALGNSGRPEALDILERATADAEPLVREHAQWAVARLKSAGLKVGCSPPFGID